MRASLKVSLSLLITLIVFSAFSLLAYSGLFNLIETNFYHPRIKNDFQKTAKDLDDKIARYHETNIERYSSGLQQGFITRSFQTNQVAEDIRQREAYFTRLRETYSDFLFCRFISPDGRRLHYSTNELDLRAREADRIVYREAAELKDLELSKVLISETDPYRLVMDSLRNRFVYSFPVRDSYNIFKGIALFYIKEMGLYNYLLNTPGYTYGELISVDESGLIANVQRETFTDEELQNLKDEVASIWQARPAAGSFDALLSLTYAGERYTLFTTVNPLYGNLGVIAPLSMFEIAPSMKIILMVSFFLTLFLVVFLILNLRQDPLLVASRRIKQFQIDFLQEYVDATESVNWDRWKRDLALKGPALKKEIKNGLGKINRSREKDIDELIDKSWDEIITVLGGKTGGELEDKSDLARIEAMLQRVVESGHLVVTGRAPAQVEEAEEVEAVEEAEEAAAAAAEEAEELEEVEEAEEVEAVEEAEEAAAAAAEEAEELEEVEEAEEVLEELEALAEIESLPAEPFEDLETLPSAEDEIEEAESEEPYRMAPLEELLSEEEAAAAVVAEEVEPEEAALVTAATPARQMSRVQSLSLRELQQKINQLRTSITVENGVYRIGKGVYDQEADGAKPELKTLADSVLKGSKRTSRGRPQPPSKRVPVSVTGFDIDEFINQFENPEKKRTQFMALVDISKRIGAVSVALLVREQDGFASELSLGLGDASVEKLRFGLDDPLTKNYFMQKKTLLINEEIGRVTQLKARFTKEDLKYLKKGVFFPSHFKNQDAVIFFGFGRTEDIDIDTILNQLNLNFQN